MILKKNFFATFFWSFCQNFGPKFGNLVPIFRQIFHFFIFWGHKITKFCQLYPHLIPFKAHKSARTCNFTLPKVDTSAPCLLAVNLHLHRSAHRVSRTTMHRSAHRVSRTTKGTIPTRTTPLLTQTIPTRPRRAAEEANSAAKSLQ